MTIAICAIFGMKKQLTVWIIPTIPVSGISEIAQCPNCKTRYEATANNAAPGTGSAPAPIADPWSKN